MNESVFISYSHSDLSVAIKIENIIRGFGIKVFRDEKDIKWGDLISARVKDELIESTILLVILPSGEVRSDWVMLEVGQAIAMNKRILPFMVQSTDRVPDLLHDIKSISSYDALSSYFSDLVENIRKSTLPKKEKSFLSPPANLLEFPYIINLKRSNMLVMKVPGIEAFSSFEPAASNNKFLQLSVFTTNGLVPYQPESGVDDFIAQHNIIYLVCDPIRPFEIQIGETRTRRPGGSVIGLSLSEEYNLERIKQLYPAIVDSDHVWMRIALAELSDKPDMLDYIYKVDLDSRVKKLASSNPAASEALKSRGCLFCNTDFIERRKIFEHESAVIFPNDYPFGPYFHYIVLPSEPVHTWSNIEETHLRDMNIAIKHLFDSDDGERALGGSVGIRIGLNSSIRHLVMGKATSTSAGASVSHIHKQVWGMAMSSFNLGDHLCHICDTYDKLNIDYLGSYIDSLRECEFIVWEDANVALYVPFGQISVHELQVMVKRAGVHTYLDLIEQEISSLSRAEYIVTRLYVELGINSFNEVLITRTFYRDIGRRFRLILTFITREIDLAASELNLVYVVDKHPTDTRKQIKRVWRVACNELKLPEPFSPNGYTGANNGHQGTSALSRRCP